MNITHFMQIAPQGLKTAIFTYLEKNDFANLSCMSLLFLSTINENQAYRIEIGRLNIYDNASIKLISEPKIVFLKLISREKVPIGQSLQKAQNGDVYSQYLVGREYFFHYTKENEESMFYHLRLASQAGFTLAHLFLGRACFDEKHYDEAFNCFTAGAKRGNGECEYYLAKCYEEGLGVESNLDMAKMHYESAFASGYENAKIKLDYFLGLDLLKRGELKEAFALFHYHAKRGDMDCEYEAGKCYENGIGVTSDLKLAFSFYRKAAIKGHEGAEEKLKNIKFIELFWDNSN